MSKDSIQANSPYCGRAELAMPRPQHFAGSSHIAVDSCARTRAKSSSNDLEKSNWWVGIKCDIIFPFLLPN